MIFWSLYELHFFIKESKFIKDPKIEPLIKLVPIIKLTGNSIVSPNKKFTLFLIELFWIPMKSIKNNARLNEIIKNSFLTEIIIISVISNLILIQVVDNAFSDIFFFCKIFWGWRQA